MYYAIKAITALALFTTPLSCADRARGGKGSLAALKACAARPAPVKPYWKGRGKTDVTFVALGDTHFVNLNSRLSNRIVRKKKRRGRQVMNPHAPLRFLKKDLRERVGASGRPVVIMSHYGPYLHMSNREQSKLYKVIKGYNVILFIHGHRHGTRLCQWKKIPVLDAGSTHDAKDGSKHYSVVRITDSQIEATDVAWHRDNFEKPEIPGKWARKIKLPLSPGGAGLPRCRWRKR